MKSSQNKRALWVGLAVLGLGFGSVGCGKMKPGFLVSDLDLSSYSDAQGQPFVKLDAALSFGNVTLVNFALPVTKDGDTIGYVTLSGSHLILDVNVNEVAGTQGSMANVLPNGNPIPVANIDPSSIVSFPAGDKAQIYASVSGGKSMLGVAVLVKGFDKLGQSTGPISVCNPIDFGKKLNGSVCIFTSNTKGQGGIAIFADTSSQTDTLSLQHNALADVLASPSSVKAAPVKFLTVASSKKKEEVIQSQFVQWHMERKKLK